MVKDGFDSIFKVTESSQNNTVSQVMLKDLISAKIDMQESENDNEEQDADGDQEMQDVRAAEKDQASQQSLSDLVE